MYVKVIIKRYMGILQTKDKTSKQMNRKSQSLKVGMKMYGKLPNSKLCQGSFRYLFEVEIVSAETHFCVFYAFGGI